MAKPTGSDAFLPITFTKSDDRGDHELVANSPSDAVRLRFDGWREKGSPAPKTAPKPSAGATPVS